MLCRHATVARPNPRQPRSTSLQATRAFVNPYKVLQISEEADSKQIKRAYRKLALRHHPDINTDPSAEDDFLRIQQAYETLTNKGSSAETDPKSNGWDFHDWYWDFTMSRRWDSHWKKTGRSGPSPFAATSSHRQQWAAQLTKLKQKAAYRRSQQQAQQPEQSWAQQQSQPEQKQQQQWQAHHSQQHDLHADQTDRSTEQHSMHAPPYSEDAAALHEQPRVSKAARHHQSGSFGHEEDEHQEAAPHMSRDQHADPNAQPARETRRTGFAHANSPSLGAARDLLDQAQSRQTQFAQCVATRTSQWQDQLTEALSQLQVRPDTAQPASSAHTTERQLSSKPQSTSSRIEDANERRAASATLQELHHLEQGPPPKPLSSAEQSSAKQSSAEQHSDGASSAANDAGEAAENSSNHRPDFETPQSRVQSQLAGLKRRAARKQAM